MRRTTKSLAVLLTAVLSLAAGSVTQAADFHTSFLNRGHFYASATVDACQNNPGPFVTLSGEILLGGVNAKLIFRNNLKGTHTASRDVSSELVLIPEDKSIRFAKQPSQGGVGGNPWIWIQFFDASGNPLTDLTLLGRCVQGLVPIEFTNLFATDADFLITAGECLNSPGPNITLEGALTVGGLNAKLVFRNNMKGTHEYQTDDIVVDINILDEGESIVIPKQPVRGGVGGNPHIFLQLVDRAGSALTPEFYLGRCSEMR